MDGSDYSELYEAAQPARPAVAHAAAVGAQPQAWAASARSAAAAVAAQPGGFAGRRALQGAQQALELTDDDSEGDSQDYDQPLAAAGGLVIDDDDF